MLSAIAGESPAKSRCTSFLALSASGPRNAAYAFVTMYLEFLMEFGCGAWSKSSVTPRMTSARQTEIPGSAKIPKSQCRLRLC
jgi:hypothetical protein